jgi:hypothetical protein
MSGKKAHAEVAAGSSAEPEILALLTSGNVVLKCGDGEVKVRAPDR